MSADREWYSAARGYLERLAAAEWSQHVASLSGRDRTLLEGRLSHGKIPARLQCRPSEYHADMVSLLGAGDRAGWVDLKARRGCDSALGH